MQPGSEVVSRRHKGLICMVVVYSNGGGIGRKIRKDGRPGWQEVCLGPADVAAERLCLPNIFGKEDR